MSEGPVTVICSYRVRPDAEQEFVELLRHHWPTLRELGLATDTEPRIFRGDDSGRGPHFVEIFEWCNEEASRLAHESPEVMATWERMGPLLEQRGDAPAMDFPHVRPFEP